MDKLLEYLRILLIHVYGIFMFLEIETIIMKVLCILMVIDTILGIIKTIVLGNQFQFRILIIGFVSKLSVLFIPLVLALMSKGLNYNFRWFVTIVVNVMIVSDGISIFSNAIAIKTKQPIANYDVITKLLKAIRTGLINLFRKFIQQIEKPYEK